METINDFAVSGDVNGDIMIAIPPVGLIPKEKALRLAAWIVAVATPHPEEEFNPVLEAVLKT